MSKINVDTRTKFQKQSRWQTEQKEANVNGSIRCGKVYVKSSQNCPFAVKRLQLKADDAALYALFYYETAAVLMQHLRRHFPENYPYSSRPFNYHNEWTEWLAVAAWHVSVAGPEVSSDVQYSSLFSGANAVFLTPVTFNQSGVVFAYIIHCRNLSPVRLQVWRPTNITTEYRLICQRRVVPTVDQLLRRAVVGYCSKLYCI